MSAALQVRLDALLRTYDVREHLLADPVQFVHRYPERKDREIVGLIAASLAFGNVVSVRRSVERILGSLGSHPATTIMNDTESTLEARLEGFVHRVYRAPHLARMLAGAGELLRAHDTLGSAFEHELTEASFDLREGVARFADRVRGEDSSRGLKHLISDPRAGSACKRLLLYLRWMVRPADGIDLGLWNISPSVLVMPVDTHVHRIARNLGLTERHDASWTTAVEITDRLRTFDPDDPVKYDFALCHLGVSRQCPSRPDPQKCAECVLKDVCKVWIH